MTGKSRIIIYGPNDDGRYVVEFQIAEVDVLAISIPINRRAAASRASLILRSV